MTYLQNFSVKNEKSKIAQRLKLLRAQMKEQKIDLYLVPRSNAYQLENVAKNEERLAWISGFTGSAGLAIIANNFAALFVDGRYILQAPKESDLDYFSIIESPPQNPADWINEKFSNGAIIGYDSWLHNKGAIDDLRQKLNKNIKLRPLDNLIDKIWRDRPANPNKKIEFLGAELTGKTASEKIAQIETILASKNCDYLVLNSPENICWLFNMRSSDVPHTPIVLCFAIIAQTGKPTIYIDKKRIEHESLTALSAIAKLAPKEDFSKDLARLSKTECQIWLDKNIIVQAIVDILEGGEAKLFFHTDPIQKAKSIKSQAELRGMKKAHLFDGIAMVKFLHWFEKNAKNSLSEIDIVKRLEDFRKEEKSLRDISFDTIAGAGANGAIVHYRVNEQSNKILKNGELMLVDSGGQYIFGTTDITRTLICGKANNEQKRRFTQTLKGLIKLSSMRFPKGTNGVQLDSLARQFLWQEGLNYNHGTGHGVGAYLNVHESPFAISPRANLALEAGIILSIEPGYYKEGEYGIRIENLVHVKESDKFSGFLEFETLTLAPIEKDLIEQKLLTKEEIIWLNNYHKMVWQSLEKYFSGEQRDWLKKATGEIAI